MESAVKDMEQFRAEVREWLEANCPPGMREPVRTEADQCWGGRNPEFSSPEQEAWLRCMAEKGWTTPEWPARYGGGGLSHDQAQVLREEMARIHARPPLTSFGIMMLGPLLLKFGSEAQRQQYLPGIIRGEVRWCQGYSEPNAGSDLASLSAKAEDRGDHFLVNGQKIWTSYADKADAMFCLVRTSSEGRVQEGISFIVFDMDSPGVSTRPIRLISGYSPFCETFLEDVKVPKENLIGEMNRGWTLAKYLLTHERQSISDMFAPHGSQLNLGLQAMEHLGSTGDGRLADTILRARIARYEIDQAAFSLTLKRTRQEAESGLDPGARSAWLKYYGTELNKRRNELLVAGHGSDGLLWSGPNPGDGRMARAWLRSKGNSIEGGTSEIQLNIIAKHLLGLPS